VTTDTSRRAAEIERLVAQARLARSRYQAELARRTWRALLRLLSAPQRPRATRMREA
jgi:hypothetical protein